MKADKALTAPAITEVDELINTNRYKEAERILLGMHKENPHFADVCNRIGQLYCDMGNYKRAKEFFQRALKLNPDYTEASLNLAVTFNELKQYGQATETMEQAGKRAVRRRTSIEPFIAGKLANKHKETGDIYKQLGLMDESIAEYRKALSLSPGFPDIQVRLAIALREVGLVDEALDVLSMTIDHRPDFVDARIQMGITFFSQGFVDHAREQWQEVLRHDPENTKARMYMNFTSDDLRDS